MKSASSRPPRRGLRALAMLGFGPLVLLVGLACSSSSHPGSPPTCGTADPKCTWGIGGPPGLGGSGNDGALLPEGGREGGAEAGESGGEVGDGGGESGDAGDAGGIDSTAG